MSVAVVVTPEQDAHRLVHWAGLFGRAEQADVVVLSAEGEKTAPPVASALERARAKIENSPEFTVVTISHESVKEDVLAHLRKDKIDLLILGQRVKSKPEGAMLELFRDAPCRAVLLRPGGDRDEDSAKVLVPTDRGPHTVLALRLGAGLAGSAGGRVTALFVQTELGEDAEYLGRKVLERRVAKALPDGAAIVDRKVTAGEAVREVIAAEAAEYDLVLAGTPDEWSARRVLFGTVQRADLYGPEGTSVAVARSSAPLPTRLQTALRRMLETKVPQLDRADRVALADTLRTSSQFNFDFVFLTSVSTLIAALGLIDNSGAVVIGAMLLAPLMTPLIGAGSAIVQGNLRFLFQTLRSVSLGFLVAVTLGVLVGAIVGPVLTPQMEARVSPGYLDLAVAFFSGVAAAYATARPGLSAALPGVAIAASLVPPLATAGICTTSAHHWRAAGAALLFTTNIIAIILGAALSLFAIGVRSRHLHGRQKAWVRNLAISALIAAGVLVIWVSFIVAEHMPEVELRLP